MKTKKVLAMVAVGVFVVLMARGVYDRLRTQEKGPIEQLGAAIDEGHLLGKSAEGHDKGANHPEPSGIVHLSDEQIKAGGIEIAVAGPGELSVVAQLPGEVRLNADRLAHMMPRFAGALKEVRKQVGDKVKKGEILAIIESNESLSSYAVTSLIAGTVIQKHATLGEIIAENSEIFVVANLDTVWVDLSIYPRDLAHIKEGQKVQISAGSGGPEVTGTIAYVGPLVSEQTRTAMARVVLPNADGRWRPGMFVSSKVQVENFSVAVRVPKDALQTVEGLTCVYVASGGGFRAVPMQLGREDDTFVEVISGVHAGESYVAAGAFLLKAEQGKGDLGNDD